jgi:hypothetical protein
MYCERRKFNHKGAPTRTPFRPTSPTRRGLRPHRLGERAKDSEYQRLALEIVGIRVLC